MEIFFSRPSIQTICMKNSKNFKFFQNSAYNKQFRVGTRFNQLQNLNSLSTRVAGNQIGNVIALPLAAILCDYFGWSAVFYFFGCLGLVWCAVWLFFVSNTPAEHKRISKLELAYITESLAQQMDESRDEEKSMETPWRQIVRSLPVWAIIVGHTCANFGTYLMLTSLPLFMDEVLNFNIKQVKLRNFSIFSPKFLEFCYRMAYFPQFRTLFTTWASILLELRLTIC